MDFKVGDVVSYRGEHHGDTGPIVKIERGYIYIENGPNGSMVGIPKPCHYLISMAAS